MPHHYSDDQTFNDYLDDLEHYDEIYSAKPKPASRTKRGGQQASAHEQRLSEAADAAGIEGGIEMSYHPARYEAVWLLQSLRPFYDEEVISDVLAMVKGGKEASVYTCRALPSTGLNLIAAKVYRPQQFRNLRNDALYSQGRQVLTGDGKAVKKTDHRIMRAIGKKTAFGTQVKHTSWLMYEYTTLQRLYEAGVAVPKPIASGENAILMEYIGDESVAAPALSSVRLEPAEARTLFDEMLRNIELMLSMGLIHGDLSAFNILYWQGKLTIIDFPQITSPATNNSARAIFTRDVQRVCEYFGRQGVRANAQAIIADLWQRYAAEAEAILEMSLLPAEE